MQLEVQAQGCGVGLAWLDPGLHHLSVGPRADYISKFYSLTCKVGIIIVCRVIAYLGASSTSVQQRLSTDKTALEGPFTLPPTHNM